MPPQRCLPEPWPHVDDGVGDHGLKGGSLCWCGVSCPGKGLARAAEAAPVRVLLGEPASSLCSLWSWPWRCSYYLGLWSYLGSPPCSAWCDHRRGSDSPCTGIGVQKRTPLFVHQHSAHTATAKPFLIQGLCEDICQLLFSVDVYDINIFMT